MEMEEDSTLAIKPASAEKPGKAKKGDGNGKKKRINVAELKIDLASKPSSYVVGRSDLIPSKVIAQMISQSDIVGGAIIKRATLGGPEIVELRNDFEVFQRDLIKTYAKGVEGIVKKSQKAGLLKNFKLRFPYEVVALLEADKKADKKAEGSGKK